MVLATFDFDEPELPRKYLHRFIYRLVALRAD